MSGPFRLKPNSAFPFKEQDTVAGQFLRQNNQGNLVDEDTNIVYHDPNKIVKVQSMDLGDEVIVAPQDHDISYTYTKKGDKYTITGIKDR